MLLYSRRQGSLYGTEANRWALRKTLCRAVAAIGVCAVPVLGLAQSSPAPTERITEAVRQSALDAPGLRPWHLKLDVMLFDDTGKNPKPGTVETWQDDTHSLTKVQFEGASRSDLYGGKTALHAASGADIPFLSEAVLAGFVHPGPSSSEITGSQPELRKETLGKEKADCIMLSQPIQHVALAPLGLFPTYCLQRDTSHLFASYDFGGQTVVRNRTGKFLDREVTIELTVMEGPVVLAKAKAISLTTFQPTKEFEPTPEMVEAKAEVPARISSGVMQGNRLSAPQPHYPESARANHISGSVVLRAIIGRDGHVHTLQPKSVPDPDLAIAAIAAVRQWTYKPYLLNGEPTEVDTTIVVNFNLSPS